MRDKLPTAITLIILTGVILWDNSRLRSELQALRTEISKITTNRNDQSSDRSQLDSTTTKTASTEHVNHITQNEAASSDQNKAAATLNDVVTLAMAEEQVAKTGVFKIEEHEGKVVAMMTRTAAALYSIAPQQQAACETAVAQAQQEARAIIAASTSKWNQITATRERQVFELRNSPTEPALAKLREQLNSRLANTLDAHQLKAVSSASERQLPVGKDNEVQQVIFAVQPDGSLQETNQTSRGEAIYSKHTVNHGTNIPARLNELIDASKQ